MSEAARSAPAAKPHTFPAKAFAASSATAALAPFSLVRRAPGPKDVHIEILFCGVCHSDLHQVRDEWHSIMPTVYPCVPGHEIVGRVVAVGKDVKNFKEGDVAAVGCLVDSCRVCDNCKAGYQQYCQNGFTLTYNMEDKHLGGVTYGGYSDHIVVDENYVLRVPKGLHPAGTAPLLCAGITTYSPLRHWKAGKGKKVGIVGLGGLGHMGLKFAHSFGAQTALFTTSAHKATDAKRLGADEVIVSKNPDEMQKHVGTFDFILDCVSAEHDLNIYLSLLKRDATLCLVGAPEKPAPVSAFNVLFGRKSLSGSAIGGLPETQEMLDYCGEHNIVSDVEIIPIQKIDEAFDRLLKSDVKYRFVIDNASLKK